MGFQKVFYHIFLNNSKPTHQNDPISGFKPVKNGEVNYLDITNDGLSIGIEPNRKAFDFWENIEQRAVQISEDLMKQKRIEL